MKIEYKPLDSAQIAALAFQFAIVWEGTLSEWHSRERAYDHAADIYGAVLDRAQLVAIERAAWDIIRGRA
jgi:hypothetical protein